MAGATLIPRCGRFFFCQEAGKAHPRTTSRAHAANMVGGGNTTTPTPQKATRKETSAPRLSIRFFALEQMGLFENSVGALFWGEGREGESCLWLGVGGRERSEREIFGVDHGRRKRGGLEKKKLFVFEKRDENAIEGD